MSQLATKHGVHQAMIAAWRKQAVEGLAGVFSSKAEATESAREGEIDKLHGKIGRLVVGRDFFIQGFRSLSVDRRRTMIEPAHPKISIQRWRALVLMRLIDEAFLETPWYGPPPPHQMAHHLRRLGYGVGRMRVRRLMGRMVLAPIY